MKDFLPPIFIYFVLFIAVCGVVYLISDVVKKHEVINPAPGVQCVVVSRMYNTSVDCWKIEK